MSEEHHDEAEHESGIKTPKQLITVIAASIIVPVIVIIMLTQFVALDNKKSPGAEGSLGASAVAARIAPVASDAVFDAAAPVVSKSGKDVFDGQCHTCHEAGLLGAPKFGDAAAWGPRVAKGYDALLQSALHGKGQMPAQGGGDYSDFEIGRAVVYMANAGGGKLAEPAAPAPAASAASGAASGASAAAPAAASAASTPASAASK